MPIYFRNAPVREPFIYDSIGNHWLQDATSRQTATLSITIYRRNPAAGGLPFRENLICFMNRKAS